MDSYLTLVKKLKEGIIIINEQKEITFTNDSINHLLGYEPNSLLGEKYYDIVYSTTEPNKLFRGCGDLNNENYDNVYLKNKKGDTVKVLMSLSSIEDKGGVFCALLFIEPESLNSSLLNKVDQLKTLVEHNTDHIFQVDTNYKITYINHVAPGLLKEDVLGTSFLNYLPSEKSKIHVQNVVDKVIQEGKASTYDVDFEAPMGTMYYQTNVTPVFENEQVVRLNFVTRDITEEFKNKLLIDQKELFLNRVSTNSQNGIYIFDLIKRRTIYANEICNEILGYSHSEYKQMSADELIDLFHPDDHGKIYKHWDQVAASKTSQPLQLVYRIKTKLGDYKWLRSKDSAYEFDENGNAISLMGSFIDITDIINLRNSQNELIKKNTEIESILYQASHDIKSPINNVAQLIELSIESGEMNDVYLDIINRSVHRLNNLVVSLLDYGETDKCFDIGEVNLNTVIQDVLVDLNDKIVDSNAKIAISKLPSIKVDKIGIYRIFQNLVSNALKFKQYMTVPSIKINFSEDDSFWTFIIEDNGIGVAEHKKDKIFEAFTKLHSSSDYDGSGLGLANCKKIVERHQGEIWVENIKGGGSRFTFTIDKSLSEKKETLRKASPLNI